jgi:hypothetical protein
MGIKKEAGNGQTRRRKICLHTYKHAYYVHAKTRHGGHLGGSGRGGGCAKHVQLRYTVNGSTGNSRILFVSDFFTILQVHIQTFLGHIIAQISLRAAQTNLTTFHGMPVIHTRGRFFWGVLFKDLNNPYYNS